MEYFDHNVNAADDDAIIALRLEHGGAAVDCYWAIVEKIYRDESPVIADINQTETKPLCHRLCLGFDDFEKYVLSMVSLRLLKVVENQPLTVTSERAEATIERIRTRKETAVQNGKKGGRPTKAKTKPKPNQNQKETKDKPIKIKEKGMETHKGFPIPNAGAGADGDDPAPHASDDGGLSAIAFIDSLDETEVRQYHSMTKAERDTFKQRKLVENMQATAVTCPAHIAEQVKGGAA